MKIPDRVKTLQEAHTDLVQRLKTELQQERDVGVQLEAKITEKDKSFDKFKQDQRRGAVSYMRKTGAREASQRPNSE